MKIKEILAEFDEKWWYDTPNLRLCSKNVPVYDEDDNLIGFNQHGAAVPRDLKAFIRTAIENAFEETRVEELKGNDLEGQEFDLTEDGFNQALNEVKQKQEEFLKE